MPHLTQKETQSGLKLRRDADELAARFPALLVEARDIAHTVACGLHGRRKAGQGETFWQHRPYSFGDAVSAIDWRQSARAPDRFYVRQNEWEAAATVYLWRDFSESLAFASSSGLPTKAHRADVLAAALAIILCMAGERVGLANGEAKAWQGRTAPERLTEALLLAGAEQSKTPILPSRPLLAGSRLVLFSDFLIDDDALENCVTSYANGGVRGVLIEINDPVEEYFPYDGRVEFRDPENGRRMIFGDAGAIRKEYTAKFIAHREFLMRLSDRAGWTMISHRTDRPAQSALLALYRAISDQRLQFS